MKTKLTEMLNAKIEQRDNLNASMVETEEREQRAVIGETLKALAKEIADLEALIAEADEPRADENEEKEEGRSMKVVGSMETKNGKVAEDKEARAKAFEKTEKMTIGNEEARAMLVSSGKIATPTQVSGINEINNEVSSIVDMVEIEDCEGMGSDKVAYEFTAPTAGVTTEGEAYAEGETVVDYVEIKPSTITTISDISRQVRNQSPIKYEEKVRKNALLALRKKASAIIIDKILASNLIVAKEISAIDEKTLRTIALGYGGDENVIGQAVLFLNKEDLVAFGDIRGTSNKNAVYEITPDTSNPNIGVIKDGGLSVKYCLNSHLPKGKMIYGQPAKAKLDLFGNYEVTVSEDFKFDKGLLTIRGNADIGCDVVYKDGFVVATVGA